ncbi:MAG TPA: hypothetical protein PKO36_17390, partial [Candidatus Hydrogenedentes bacterium]|nr:hypothetical protein [Candidatus Hydrogenedentota bacterium]
MIMPCVSLQSQKDAGRTRIDAGRGGKNPKTANERKGFPQSRPLSWRERKYYSRSFVDFRGFPASVNEVHDGEIG